MGVKLRWAKRGPVSFYTARGLDCAERKSAQWCGCVSGQWLFPQWHCGGWILCEMWQLLVFSLFINKPSLKLCCWLFFFFSFLPSFPPILSSRFLGYLGCVQVILCPLPFELTSLCSAGASQPLRLEDKKWNTFPSRNGCKTGQESPPIGNLLGVWVFHARSRFAIIETPQRGTY